MDPTEITYEMVNKKLREIALARGKKGVDRQEQVHHLRRFPATCARHKNLALVRIRPSL